MNRFYHNILDSFECEAISHQMMIFYIEGKTRLENNEKNPSKNSEGFYNLPAAIKLLSKVEKHIKEDYGSNIAFENSFTRIYRNGSSLRCHVDRKNLDITLSVRVHGDDSMHWPLCVSKKSIDISWNKEFTIDYMLDYDQYHTPIGCGVACLGTKSPHWREILTCNSKDVIIQTFFHWKILT